MQKGGIQYLQEKPGQCFPEFSPEHISPPSLRHLQWQGLSEITFRKIRHWMDIGNDCTLISQLVGYLVIPEAESGAPDIAQLELWEEAETHAGKRSTPRLSPGSFFALHTYSDPWYGALHSCCYSWVSIMYKTVLFKTPPSMRTYTHLRVG